MTKQVYRADIRPYQDRIAALEARVYDLKGAVATAEEYAREVEEEKADLEAELAKMRQRRSDLTALADEERERANRMGARAEKAEAEVERLKSEAYCPATTNHRHECKHFHLAKEWGGGRESVTPGGGTSPSGVSPSPPRKDTCPDCGEVLAQYADGYGHLRGFCKAAAEPAAPRPDWWVHIQNCPDPECASKTRAERHMDAARKERDG